MKVIRNIQMNLAVIATVSMTMSPLAMAMESKNLALTHKKRLEQFQLSKRGQTYGEYWAKVRGEYDPKVRKKLDQWAFNMRNEKMPEVSYSTFIDRDGSEKLRVHFSKNGKTDTMTIHATDEKALAFNNVNISPEEAASVDSMVMKIMAEDEKKGREMINAPSFSERRPASSPPTLRADEFFKLDAKQRVQYMRDYSKVLETVEALQNREYEIKAILDIEAPKEKKQGAFFEFLKMPFMSISVFADVNDFRELSQNNKRDEQEKKLRSLSDDCSKNTNNCKDFSKELEKYKLKYPRRTSFYREMLVTLGSKEAESNAQLAIQQNVALDELHGSAATANSCFSGAAVGKVETINKQTFCKQDSTLNATFWNKNYQQIGIKFVNKCNKNQAFCEPLLYGVSDNNSYKCVDVVETSGDKKNNITQLCNEHTQNDDIDLMIARMFGEKTFNKCGIDVLCKAKAKQIFDQWKSQLDQFILQYDQICTSTKAETKPEKLFIIADSVDVSAKNYGLSNNHKALNGLRNDQEKTCLQLKDRLAKLNEYILPTGDVHSPQNLHCDSINATNLLDGRCKCKSGPYEGNIYLVNEASKFCMMSDGGSNSNTDVASKSAKCNAIGEENKVGAWEKVFNPFWSKRAKYSDETKLCDYPWYEKYNPLGMMVGVGALFGLGKWVKDRRDDKKDKKAEEEAEKAAQ